jgi:hypothetical protein
MHQRRTHQTRRYGDWLGNLLGLFCAIRGMLLSFMRLGPSYKLVTVQPPASRGLVQVADLMVEGKVTPLIDRVVPLEQVSEASSIARRGWLSCPDGCQSAMTYEISTQAQQTP